MSSGHSNLNDKDTKFLWAAAGGRCQMCNEPLTQSGLTFRERNIGERAHINGQGGIKSPRYDPELSPTLAKSLENVMLLCFDCHAEIDSDEDRFTVEMLRDIKRKQEERIFYLTSLEPNRTRVLVLQSHIQQGVEDGEPIYQAVTLHREDLHNAILPDYFPDQARPSKIKLDLATTESESHWEQIRQDLRQKWNRQDLDDLEHLSVFSLGKMPAVAYFGRLVGNTRKLRTMNVQRGVPTRWKSKEQVPQDFKIEARRLEDGVGAARDVVLLLSLSGTVEKNQYVGVVPEGAAVYEIAIPKAQRNPDWLMAEAQLTAFVKQYKLTLSEIQEIYGQDATIHLLAAAPTPILFEVGRQYRPNHHPSLLIYNCVSKRFSPAFNLGG
ncbi:SAVED domain-containing protein [Deinococcus sp. RM]|uniref:SAVED domain-containing protein n=1 Tax=Deinococcus sp. RM TaxID=2316359 RepID=UPI001314FDF8|nr:SAVED domain-containing protein [Deinococcus sp. RM]